MERIPEQACGNIYIRPNYLNRGTVVGNHTHNFDHTTILLKGSVLVAITRPDGSKYTETLIAPRFVLIKANYCHEITGLEDDTEFWCVYAHRTPQGEIVQETQGWLKGYS